MTIQKIILIILILLKVQILYSNEEICILETRYNLKTNEKKTKIQCPNELLKQKFSSGSLFKIFLTASGYYYRLFSPLEKESIKEKLKNSENPYFIRLLNKIQKEKFLLFLNTNLTKYLNRKILIQDFTDDFSFLYGGKLTFYPIEIHNWFLLLLQEERDYMNLTLESLKREENGIQFYGKSGTWSGAAWFCGILIEEQEKKVISVLVPYKKNHWQPAKEKAYQQFLNLIKN
ncbi:MAG: hypothetical protein ACK4UJ_11040 [Leptonema sp. (in: bacteria)]